MNKILLFLFGCVITFSSCNTRRSGMSEVIEKGLERSVLQSKAMAYSLLDDKNKLPRTIGKDGKLLAVDSHDWTSGFYPGVLWYLFEVTHDDSLKYFASEYTQRVLKEQYTTDNHDVGFIISCSFGNGYRLTKNPQYKDVLVQAAHSLSTRYRETVQCIRSWDFNQQEWQYPVIIDNMMNLELLLEASSLSGDSRFEQIARKHADTTIKNHFRSDYSSYHVVSYDTITGLPEKKQTSQGFSDESSWARGQAWAIYGYTVVFRETGDPKYLEFAEKLVDVYLKNLPEDYVPYWDFNAPDIPNAPKDASAACVVASALLEMSGFYGNGQGEKYKEAAEKMLCSLSSDKYQSRDTNVAFLLHSTGHWPAKSEIDASIIYADYYYIEALLRLKRINEGLRAVE